MGSRAAPPITAWCVDQPSSHWVEFDIARGGQQVWLIEDEGGEPPLPQMASPPLSEVDHSGVTPMGFADRSTQTVGRLGDSDEVDMVGHQAVRPDLNVVDAARLRHQFQVRLIILIAKERWLAAISPLGEVVRQARYDNPCQSRHESSLSTLPSAGNN
jgi:hypothetical protein